jgi:hypothetical protein
MQGEDKEIEGTVSGRRCDLFLFLQNIRKKHVTFGVVFVVLCGIILHVKHFVNKHM